MSFGLPLAMDLDTLVSRHKVAHDCVLGYSQHDHIRWGSQEFLSSFFLKSISPKSWFDKNHTWDAWVAQKLKVTLTFVFVFLLFLKCLSLRENWWRSTYLSVCSSTQQAATQEWPYSKIPFVTTLSPMYISNATWLWNENKSNLSRIPVWTWANCTTHLNLFLPF